MIDLDKVETIEILRSMRTSRAVGIPDGLTFAEIDAAECRLGISLPSELREWLTVSNGPCIGRGYFLGIQPANCSEDIGSVLGSYSNWFTNRWIPFASDGCGNYYVIVPETAMNSIGFVDCASDPEEIAYVAASRLWKFLRYHLLQDALESGWPFERDAVVAIDPDILDSKLPFPWDV